MNQIVEQYLRIYCNYQQDDWSSLLPLAEFAINNSRQDSTKVSPHFANYGYHPRFTSANDIDGTVPAAQEHADNLHKLHETLVENVTAAQNTQAKYYDAKHKLITFAPGDKVWLQSSNLQTQRPSKKLDWKRLGPFEVVERIGLQAYRLRLPSSMKCHDVFHVSLLEPYRENSFPGRKQPPPPPVVVEGASEWEVQEILDSRFIRRKLHYKIRWVGYSDSEDSWEPAENVDHAPELVKEFHERYPQKPSPTTSAPQSRPRRKVLNRQE
jgi:hypothetical protein